MKWTSCLLLITILRLNDVLSLSLSSVFTGNGRLNSMVLKDGHDTNALAGNTQVMAPCYILLSNLQSGSNIGDICRNALAFNVSEVIIIGRSNYAGKMRGADRGAKRSLKFVEFPSTPLAAAYLKEEKKATIIGIEIMTTALPITAANSLFQGPTAFMFGNEGGGMSATQKSVCDKFAYIPQYGEGAYLRKSFDKLVDFKEARLVGELQSTGDSVQQSVEVQSWESPTEFYTFYLTKTDNTWLVDAILKK